MAEQFGFLILNAPERIRQQGRGWFGVRIEPGSALGPATLPPEAECVIVAAAGRERSQELLRLAHAQGCRALLEVSSAEEAVMAGELGFDGVVSRSPLDSPVPVWGAGGIGLHSAAAWYAGGAAGVVLDFADASWAVLARQFRTVPAVVRGLRDAIRRYVELAKKHARLEPLASAPPDTRVLDTLLDTLNDASVEALLAGGETSVALSGYPRRPLRGDGGGDGRAAGGKGRAHRHPGGRRLSATSGPLDRRAGRAFREPARRGSPAAAQAFQRGHRGHGLPAAQSAQRARLLGQYPE